MKDASSLSGVSRRSLLAGLAAAPDLTAQAKPGGLGARICEFLDLVNDRPRALEVSPNARRVGLLWDASSRDQADAAAEAQDAHAALAWRSFNAR